MIAISIVSHNQINLVGALLNDLTLYSNLYKFEVVLTLNVPENITFDLQNYPYKITVIKNIKKLGFGANHNQAFRASSGDIFCVLNPDIRLPVNPFDVLLQHLQVNPDDIVAPLVLSKKGNVEDSARKYPTIKILIKKFFNRHKASLDYEFDNPIITVDWLAGMFLMFNRSAYHRLNGFDEKYFMYYEDVDLCLRNRLEGFNNSLVTTVSIIHDAQRSSRIKIKYMMWHLKSCMLFLCKQFFYNAIRKYSCV